MAGCGIFKAMHGFLGIGHRDFRTIYIVGIDANKQPAFILKAVDTAGVKDLAELFGEIVFIEIFQRGFDMRRVEQVAKTA